MPGLGWGREEDSVKQQSSQTQGRELKCLLGREERRGLREPRGPSPKFHPVSVLSRNSSSQDSSSFNSGTVFSLGHREDKSGGDLMVVKVES